MDAVLNGAVILLGTVATLVLVATGLAVIFGFMRIINFAHGEFLALGAFTVLVCDRQGVPFALALVVAPLVGAHEHHGSDEDVPAEHQSFARSVGVDLYVVVHVPARPGDPLDPPHASPRQLHTRLLRSQESAMRGVTSTVLT